MQYEECVSIISQFEMHHPRIAESNNFAGCQVCPEVLEVICPTVGALLILQPECPLVFGYAFNDANKTIEVKLVVRGPVNPELI